MKLFKTTSMEIVQLSQTYFSFELPSVLLKKELKGLETSIMHIITLATIHRLSYNYTDNVVSLMFVSCAVVIFHC